MDSEERRLIRIIRCLRMAERGFDWRETIEDYWRLRGDAGVSSKVKH